MVGRPIWEVEGRWWTYVGTAGVMLDFSFAAGLEPILSSFSRRDFSSEMILRVAILDGDDGDEVVVGIDEFTRCRIGLLGFNVPNDGKFEAQ